MIAFELRKVKIPFMYSKVDDDNSINPHQNDQGRKGPCFFNPLPHRVIASFCLTAGGLLRPPEEDDISREKMILMT